MEKRQSSPEYETLLVLTSTLWDAVKSDIIALSCDLLSCGLISPDNDSELRNTFRSEPERSARLVELVRNKVLQDPEHYHTFVHILRGKPDYYRHVLKTIEQTFSERQQVKETTENIHQQSRSVDEVMGRLEKESLFWMQNEDKIQALTREWERKKIEWDQFQQKRKEIAEGYGEIVQDQLKELRSYQLFFLKMYDEVDELLVKQAKNLSVEAEVDLRHSQDCSEFFCQLEEHLGNLQDQKVYIQSHREELTKRKEGLQKSLEKLNDLKLETDECFNDIQECGEALAKCDRGLMDCRSRIDQIKEKMEEVNRQREKILKEVSDCEVKLTSNTKELEQCQSRLQQCIGKLAKTSEELDGSIIKATTAYGSAVGGAFSGLLGVAGTTMFALASPIAAPVATVVAIGTLAAAGGSGIGGILGHQKGTTIQEENEKRRSALKYCQEDLEKCDNIIKCLGNIVKECREEINRMKKIIAKNRQSCSAANRCQNSE